MVTLIKSTTCGQAKFFKWEINDDVVIIYRIFKNGPRKDIIPLSIFDQLNNYVIQKGFINLFNNVDIKTHNAEDDGIGSYLIRNYNYKSSDAQIASQVAAILCQVGAWTNNNKKKNIEFYSVVKDCRSMLLNYYCEKTTL